VSIVKGKRILWREAIRILMQSPIYFKMSPSERKILVQEFCVRMGESCESASLQVRNRALPTASAFEDFSSSLAADRALGLD